MTARRWTLDVAPAVKPTSQNPLSLASHLINSPVTIAPTVPMHLYASSGSARPLEPAALLTTLGGPLPQREASETREAYIKRALTLATRKWTSDLNVTVHTPQSFDELYTDNSYEPYYGRIPHAAEPSSAATEDETDDTCRLTIVDENCIVIDLSLVAERLERWNRWLTGSLIYHGTRASGMTRIYTPRMAFERLTMEDEAEIWHEILHDTSQALLSRAQTKALSPDARREARKARRQRRYTKEAMEERRKALEVTEILSPKMIRTGLRKEVLDAERLPLTLGQLQELADHPATTPTQQRIMKYLIGLLDEGLDLAHRLNEGPRYYANYNDDTGELYNYAIETSDCNSRNRGYSDSGGMVTEAANDEMQYTMDNCANILPMVTYRSSMEQFPDLLTLADRYVTVINDYWTTLEEWPLLGITPEMTEAGADVTPIPPTRPIRRTPQTHTQAEARTPGSPA